MGGDAFGCEASDGAIDDGKFVAPGINIGDPSEVCGVLAVDRLVVPVVVG